MSGRAMRTATSRSASLADADVVFSALPRANVSAEPGSPVPMPFFSGGGAASQPSSAPRASWRPPPVSRSFWHRSSRRRRGNANSRWLQSSDRGRQRQRYPRGAAAWSPRRQQCYPGAAAAPSMKRAGVGCGVLVARLSSRSRWISPPPGTDAAVGQKPCRCRMPGRSCESACSRAARRCALAPRAQHAWAMQPYPPFRVPVCCPPAPHFPVALRQSFLPQPPVSGPQGSASASLQWRLSDWRLSAVR